MESKARLRYYRSSPRKVRLVADLIRGQKIDEAISRLRLSHKHCAADLEKLVRSALANLEQSHPTVDVDDVVVKTIMVDEGPMLKRGRPASKWVRWHRILKRMCHVTVELAVRD